MSDTDTITTPKPTVVETLEFVDAIPGTSRTGRPDIYAEPIARFLPVLKENAGKPAVLATNVTNSATTRLNKEYGEAGLKFTFRAVEGTDGKRGNLYVTYNGVAEPKDLGPISDETVTPKGKK